MRGALRAALLGSSNQSEILSAGWESWRQDKCPEGNDAFHKAKSNGFSDKEAMKAFWEHANKGKPVALAIAGILSNGHGLRLSGGREINWHIASLKLGNAELDLTPERACDLINALVAKGFEQNAKEFIVPLYKYAGYAWNRETKAWSK